MKTRHASTLAALISLLLVNGALAQTPTAYSTIVSNDDPVLYWNFDGGTTDAVQQMPLHWAPVGNRNDLVPSTTNSDMRVSHSSLGDGLNLGNAASCDGTDYFGVSDLYLGPKTLTGPYAIELWVKVNGTPTSGEYVLSFGNNAPAVIYNFNTDFLELFAGAGGRTGLAGPPITDQNWHHVLFVYYGDGTNGVADRVDAYVDGTDYPDIGGGMSAPLSLGSGVFAGAATGGANPFDGDVDEVALYDLSDLTNEAQVTAAVSAMATNHLLAATSGTNYTSQVLADNPLLYWNFNEASGDAHQLAPITFSPASNSQNDLIPTGSAQKVSHASLGDGLLLGDCAALDGNSSYVQLGSLESGYPDNALTGPWALEMWVQLNGSQSDKYIFTTGGNPPYNSPSVIYGYYGPRLEMYGVSDGRSGTNGIPISANKWHYLMIVNYDTAPGTNSPGTNVNRVDFFIDGVQYTNVGGGFNTPFDFSRMIFGSAGPAQGGGTAANTGGIDGYVDELAMYDLSAYTNVTGIEARVAAMAASHYAAAFADSGYGTITINAQPQNTIGQVGQSVTFNVSASVTGTTEPLTYQWLKNGLAISGATNSTYTKVATLYDVGTNNYQVRLDAGPAHQFSSTATLIVPPPPPPSPTEYGQVIRQEQPLFYWNFDEVSGPAIQQMLVTNVPVTTENDLVPVTTTGGISMVSHSSMSDGLDNLGNYAQLDGNSYFLVNSFRLATNTLNGPWAMEYWVQTPTPGLSQSYLYNFGNGGGNVPASIYGFYTNQLELFGGAGGRTGTNGPTVADSNWHHVLWVDYDTAPAGTNNQVDVYFDGVLHTNVGGGFNSPVSLTRLIFGAATTTPDNGFDGGLDEFAVYDLSGMSAAQIATKAQYMATNDYAVAHETGGPSYTATVLSNNPTLYYNFNESSGDAPQLAPVTSLPPVNSVANSLVPYLGAGRVEHSVLNDGLYLGNAADFNGSSYYEASQLSPGRTGLNPPWAVGFWMQSLGTNQGSYLMNFGNYSPAFVFNSSGVGTPDELDLFDGANYTASGAVVSDSKWHHVLWVDYGNSTVGVADRVDVYLDGVDYPDVQNAFSSSLDVTHDLILASSHPGYDYFKGRLDDLAVYDLSSLTNEAEVTAVVQGMVTNELAAAVVPPPQRPTLNLSAAGGQLTLSWQGTAYVLQENTNLDNPAGWFNVGSSNSPVVITPAKTGNRFYRLSSQ